VTLAGQWIEVFRTGTHTDSAGNARTWTEADLDMIVSQTTASGHEPPVVVGHPADNAPAFGWVESLKRSGPVLMAKLKQVAAEFEEAVKEGRYKKRSISLYPDLTLRHLGWLGGMPPAVKGLADVAFAEGAATTIEFSDHKLSAVGRMFLRLKTFLADKFTAEEADRVIGDWELQDLMAEEPGLFQEGPTQEGSIQSPPTKNGPKQSAPTKNEEDDMDLKQFEERLASQDAKLQEFGEALKAKDATIAAQAQKIEALGKDLAGGQDKVRVKEFADFCGQLGSQGKLSPAQAATAQRLYSALPAQALRTAVEFGEGADKKTSSPEELLRELLSGLPVQLEFGEHATKSKIVNGLDLNNPQAVANKARELVDSEAKAGRSMSFAEAVERVSNA